jgi:hypothetical protein
MRTLILLALTLPLASCATGGFTPASVTTTLATIEQDIVGYAQSLCGFQPSLTTVEQIITTLYPAASALTVPEQSIAQTICSVVPPAPKAGQRLGSAAPLYPGTGIVIHGKYVSRAGVRLRRR